MNSPHAAAISEVATRVLLLTRVAALEVYRTDDGQIYSGLIAELPAGAEIEISGAGFNHRTVLAYWEKRNYYVYLQDLENQASSTAF